MFHLRCAGVRESAIFCSVSAINPNDMISTEHIGASHLVSSQQIKGGGFPFRKFTFPG